MSLDNAAWRSMVYVGIPLLGAALALYAWLLPSYQRLVLLETSLILRVGDPSLSLWTDGIGRWGVDAGSASHEMPRPLGGPRHSLGAFLALAIVPPLLAAAPGSLSSRLRMTMLGIVTVNALHLAVFTAYIVLFLATCESGRLAGICRNLKGAVIYSNHAAALLVFWALTWKRFTKPLDSERVSSAKP